MTAADKTATGGRPPLADPVQWYEPAEPVGVVDSEPDPEKPGYLLRIRSTALRRTALIGVLAVGGIVLAVCLPLYAAFSLASAFIAGAQEAWLDLRDRFAFRRAARLIGLGIFMAWAPDYHSDHDAVVERMRALAKRWRR